MGTGERLNEIASATDTFGNYRDTTGWIATVPIRPLWGGERISFTGHYFRTDEPGVYDNAGDAAADLCRRERAPRAPPWPADGCWIAQARDINDAKLPPRSPRALKRPDEIPPPWVSGRTAVVGTTRRPPAPPTCGDSPLGPSTAWAGRDVPPSRTRSRKSAGQSAVGTDPGVHIGAVVRGSRRRRRPLPAFPQDRPTAIDFYRTNVLPELRWKPLDRAPTMVLLINDASDAAPGNGCRRWGLETDPQYQSKLGLGPKIHGRGTRNRSPPSIS